jgi:hypothetical protein
MTGHEKKINKQDLHSYKTLDPQVHAMIPGIHNYNTVGSSPTKRGKNIQEHSQQQMQLVQNYNTRLPEINTQSSP